MFRDSKRPWQRKSLSMGEWVSVVDHELWQDSSSATDRNLIHHQKQIQIERHQDQNQHASFRTESYFVDIAPEKEEPPWKLRSSAIHAYSGDTDNEEEENGTMEDWKSIGSIESGNLAPPSLSSVSSMSSLYPSQNQLTMTRIYDDFDDHELGNENCMDTGLLLKKTEGLDQGVQGEETEQAGTWSQLFLDTVNNVEQLIFIAILPHAWMLL